MADSPTVESVNLKVCDNCEKKFPPKKKWQRFCNGKCRNDFHNRKRILEPMKN